MTKIKNEAIKGSPQLKSSRSTTDKEVADLKIQLKDYKKQIDDLTAENEQLNSQMQSTGPVSDRHNRVVENNTLKTRTITKIVHVPGERVPADKIGELFTSLKKARVVKSLINHLEVRILQRAFSQIQRSGVQSKDALNSASRRLKGRLLQVLHEKYADAGGVRKCFLRWWVAVHHTFQRDCITKVALNARLTHQSALWRFRKLVIKGVKVRLPEAVRKMRYITGLLKLDSLSRGDHVTKLIQAFNEMRPDIVSKTNMTLIKVVINRAVYEEKVKLKKMYEIMRNHRNQKSLLKKLVDRYTRKLANAFDKLSDNGKSLAGEKPEDIKKNRLLKDLLRSLRHQETDALRRLAKNADDLKAKERQDKLLKNHLFNSLAGRQNAQLKDALKNLRDNYTASVIIEQETVIKVETVKIVRQKTTKAALERLCYAQRSKQVDAVNNSKLNRDAERKLAARKDQLLKILTNKLKGASKGKSADALKELLQAKRDQEIIDKIDRTAAENAKRFKDQGMKLLNAKAINSCDSKLRQAYLKLKNLKLQLSPEENEARRRITQTMATLGNSLKGPEVASLRDLVAHLVNSGDSDSIFKIDDIMSRENKARIMNELFDKLKKGCNAKNKQSMNGLKDAYKSVRAIESIEGMNQRLNKKLTTKLVRGLVQAQKAKMLHALARQTDFYRVAAAEQAEKDFETTLVEHKKHDKIKSLMKKLISGLNGQRESAMQKLRDNAIDQKISQEKQDQIKILEKGRMDGMIRLLISKLGAKRDESYNKLKSHGNLGNIDPETMKKNNLVTTLINHLKEKQNLAARKLINNHKYAALQEILANEKKAAILKKMLGANDSKLREVMSKLLRNKKDQEQIERDSETKQRLAIDGISYFCLNQIKAGRHECYIKMIAFAQEQRKHESMKRKLIKALVNCNLAAQNQALYMLRQKNFEIWSNDQINETIMNIKVDRDLNLKRKLLKNLCKAFSLKGNQAFKLLEYNSSQRKEREEEAKKKLEAVLGKAKSLVFMGKIDAYRKMIAYANKNRDYDKRLKNVLTNTLSKMHGAYRFSELQALHRLIAHKNEMDAQRGNKYKKTKTLVQKLVSAHELKQIQALGAFRYNKAETELSEYSKRKALTGTGLAPKLNSCSTLKMLDALNRLRNNANELAKRDAAINQLLGKLRGAYKAKQGQAFGELSGQGIGIDPERANELEESMLHKIRKGNADNNEQGDDYPTLSREDALSQFVDRLGESARREAIKQKIIKALGCRLTSSNANKRDQIYAILKNYAGKQATFENDTNNKKKKLVEKLYNSYNTKSNDAKNLMKENFIKAKEIANMEKLKKSVLVNKLKTRLGGRLGDAFDKLRNNGVKSRLLKDSLLKKLIKSQEHKQVDCLRTIRNAVSAGEIAATKKDMLKKKLLSKLIDNMKSKAKDACSRLQNNKVRGETSDMKQKIQESNSTKVLVDKLKIKTKKETQMSMQKLITHCLNERIRQERIKKLLSEIRSKETTKVIRCVYQLKINSLKDTVKSVERREKISQLIQRMYRRLTKGGYQKLVNNAFMKQKLVNTFNRAEKLNILRIKKLYLERLKDLLKQSGQRAVKVFTMLNALIRLRERAAFSEMNLRYQLDKRDKWTRDLVKFSNFVDRTALKRKSESFAIIKKQFYNDNPWFKHSILKMSVYAQTCEQTAFWKMRLLKNLGEDNVSAEKSIKLRRILEIIEKRKSKAVNFSFARILISVSNPDSMNVSFLAQQRIGSVISPPKPSSRSVQGSRQAI